MTIEQSVVDHAIMIATYSGVAVSFCSFLWFEFCPPSIAIWKKVLGGYAAAYIPFVLIVLAFDKYITYRVYTFDHNGDRAFQDSELVGDLAFFFDAMISDSSRNLAPIVGLFTSVIATLIAFALAFLVGKVIRIWHRTATR